MSGHVGNLSPQQEAALLQFKEHVKDALKPNHDDHFLLRWLRARNFNLKATEAMFREDVAWRKQYAVDEILENFEVPKVLKKYFTGGHCGYDRHKNPVYIDPYPLVDWKDWKSGFGTSTGNTTVGMIYIDLDPLVDWKGGIGTSKITVVMTGILSSATTVQVLKSRVHEIESIIKYFEDHLAKTGERIDNVIAIYDLEGLGLKHLWKPGVDMYLELVAMFEAHYPETLKYVFIVNAPKYFPVAYNMVKPFLSEATVKKVHVLGSNFKETLLKHIAPEELPKHYGGTRVDEKGDPKCGTIVRQGGQVPREFYRKIDKSELDGYSVINVGRGSSVQQDYNVKVPGSILRWSFATDGYDLGIGIYKRTSDSRQKASDMEEIVPTRRFNSHLVPVDDSIGCQETGTYVVRFDNTYSYLRSKKVYYQIEVLEPDIVDCPEEEDDFKSDIEEENNAETPDNKKEEN